jgi:hypothetical protein
MMKPNPDYTRLMRAINRCGDPGYVPCLELVADPEFIAAYLGEAVPITWNQQAETRKATDEFVLEEGQEGAIGFGPTSNQRIQSAAGLHVNE